MLRSSTILFLAVLATVACATSALAHHSHHETASSKNANPVGAYDYYVMSLSWSPTFCQTHRGEDEQCNHKGYGFVLHGLWPQVESGRGPEHCANAEEPDGSTVVEARAFMSSTHLIYHEWNTHGACTGLSPKDYFALADRAFASVHAPPEMRAPRQDLHVTADDVREAFKRTNPGLADNMMNLHCSKGELVDVRICLDKKLVPRACGKRMRTGCPVTAPFTIPATR